MGRWDLRSGMEAGMDGEMGFDKWGGGWHGWR